jgi:hypothetical protein
MRFDMAATVKNGLFADNSVASKRSLKLGKNRS